MPAGRGETGLGDRANQEVYLPSTLVDVAFGTKQNTGGGGLPQYKNGFDGVGIFEINSGLDNATTLGKNIGDQFFHYGDGIRSAALIINNVTQIKTGAFCPLDGDNKLVKSEHQYNRIWVLPNSSNLIVENAVFGEFNQNIKRLFIWRSSSIGDSTHNGLVFKDKTKVYYDGLAFVFTEINSTDADAALLKSRFNISKLGDRWVYNEDTSKPVNVIFKDDLKYYTDNEIDALVETYTSTITAGSTDNKAKVKARVKEILIECRGAVKTRPVSPRPAIVTKPDAYIEKKKEFTPTE